jgi:hypothetical protein
MRKMTITRNGEKLQIEAPEGKSMTIDQQALINGVVAVGEYGPSGIKIAAFSDWTEVIFDCEDAGYVLTELNPF